MFLFEKKREEETDLRTKAQALRLYNQEGGRELTPGFGEELTLDTHHGRGNEVTRQAFEGNTKLQKEYKLLFSTQKIKEEQAFKR